MKKMLSALMTVTFVLGMTGISWAFSMTYNDAITPASPLWFNAPHGAAGTYGYHIYDFSADSTAAYNMETTGSTFATYLYLFDRTVDPSNAPPSSDYLVSGAGASGISFDLTSGDSYCLVTTSVSPFTQGSFTNAINDSVVPIPGAVWLFASGLLGLLGYKKKLNKK